MFTNTLKVARYSVQGLTAILSIRRQYRGKLPETFWGKAKLAFFEYAYFSVGAAVVELSWMWSKATLLELNTRIPNVYLNIISALGGAYGAICFFLFVSMFTFRSPHDRINPIIMDSLARYGKPADKDDESIHLKEIE